MITYSDTHSFDSGVLGDLFLSVGWSSGHYPEKCLKTGQTQPFARLILLDFARRVLII